MIPFSYRKRGLYRQVRRYPFAEGIVCAFDISVDDGPAAKTVIFETRKAMRQFYRHFRNEYFGDMASDVLGARCAGFVNKLVLHHIDTETEEIIRHTVDRRYFCLVGLVEGLLHQEILTHEAVHVGFAHAFRHGENSSFHDPQMNEESTCYPAGRWAEQLMMGIEKENLRTHGGDSKKARLAHRRY